ncbi:sugar ABC transporter permease [Deinococcus sp. KSM4-11]|uniref:carbohydrate ABC transporter permease n=1 Tax=Deinococcus sp. KSM4-11 TaxID=2568654 RepID=UPI0010A522C8|nr:sugar ABC transporter permease [Deinococcus sp. KSM4-11]THF87163.1 sugar ABC transporter permease [Deinococcus sp. KSM4-11]
MTTSHPRAPGGRRGLHDNHPLVPYLFLLPHALFFLVFLVYPIVFGLYISVHRWDPLSDTQPFVGAEFYLNLFRDTPQRDFFWRTLVNTLLFTVISVPLLVATALGLAQLLFRPIALRTVFRSIFFMPGILSVSVMGILWKWMFENQSGLVNNVLGQMGQPTIPFLTTDGWAWVPITVGTVWWTIGFNMTLYLAAMGNIPTSVYEAAELDGASGTQKFRYITFPLLQPTTLFVVVTTVLASLQLFGQTQVITGGGPARGTQSVIMYITEEAFSNNQFSSATAMSFVFGLLMLVFTAIQFRTMARDIRGGDKG